MIQVGDTVLCVNDKSLSKGVPPPLKVGQEYEILGIHKCGCGSISFDVGLQNTRTVIRCSKCSIVTKSYVWWCNSSRFVKADLLNDALREELQEVDEDYFLIKR